jgi:hypothetical protein
MTGCFLSGTFRELRKYFNFQAFAMNEGEKVVGGLR